MDADRLLVRTADGLEEWRPATGEKTLLRAGAWDQLYVETSRGLERWEPNGVKTVVGRGSSPGRIRTVLLGQVDPSDHSSKLLFWDSLLGERYLEVSERRSNPLLGICGNEVWLDTGCPGAKVIDLATKRETAFEKDCGLRVPLEEFMPYSSFSGDCGSLYFLSEAQTLVRLDVQTGLQTDLDGRLFHTGNGSGGVAFLSATPYMSGRTMVGASLRVAPSALASVREIASDVYLFSLSPDGSSVAWTSGASFGDPGALQLTRLSDGDRTIPLAPSAHAPYFSVDGSMIAFVAKVPDGQGRRSDLRVHEIASGKTWVVEPEADVRDWSSFRISTMPEPRFSDDGRFLVFVASWKGAVHAFDRDRELTWALTDVDEAFVGNFEFGDQGRLVAFAEYEFNGKDRLRRSDWEARLRLADLRQPGSPRLVASASRIEKYAVAAGGLAYADGGKVVFQPLSTR
ncbi:hypothetical protein AKJ08_2125 [Vulgatibacter incomptus]|uniref:TolB protein n=1 Tax=Vulgatibacter incomptus TaxID=1391653 RepID=A0A0K1PDX7_9BACT|nr:hypothetical protein AKJ08_2125 [Vulgatibacter incomptus]